MSNKIFMIKKEGYKPIFIEEKEYMDLDYIECKIESMCNDKGMFNYFIDLNCNENEMYEINTKEEILIRLQQCLEYGACSSSLLDKINRIENEHYEYILLTCIFGCNAVAIIDGNNEGKYKLIDVVDI